MKIQGNSLTLQLSAKPAFANEKTEQDRKQLAPLANNFFQNSSIPS
jgi:hypothetical protein